MDSTGVFGGGREGRGGLEGELSNLFVRLCMLVRRVASSPKLRVPLLPVLPMLLLPSRIVVHPWHRACAIAGKGGSHTYAKVHAPHCTATWRNLHTGSTACKNATIRSLHLCNQWPLVCTSPAARTCICTLCTCIYSPMGSHTTTRGAGQLPRCSACPSLYACTHAANAICS